MPYPRQATLLTNQKKYTFFQFKVKMQLANGSPIHFHNLSTEVPAFSSMQDKEKVKGIPYDLRFDNQKLTIPVQLFN